MSSRASTGAKRLRAGAVLLAIIATTLAPAQAAHSAHVDRAAPGPHVRYPADQAAHAGVQNEWWYVVGHLHSGSRTFGYEVTIFRFVNVRPPGFTVPVTLYRTDVAITDESAHRFHQHVSYYFGRSARFSYSSLSARVGSASLVSTSQGAMKLRAALPGGTVALDLTSRRAPMNVGGSGYIPFLGGYTYYYSLTDLGTSGTLTLGGKKFGVQGISWLDHQWGNWRWGSSGGWIWMALQLDNGVQLSVFDVRGPGATVRAASALGTDGRVQTLRDTQIQSLSSWRSPHTHGTYPSGWIVRIPSAGASLHVQPTVKDQELIAPGEARGSYWEGSGRISGTWNHRRVTGLSYTELTGYAQKFGP